MSLNHGINTYNTGANYGAVRQASVGIPFFVGAWPCHMGEGFVGKPQLVTNFAEAKTLGGYSPEWRDESGNAKWGLCQAMYAMMTLNAIAPAVVYNVYDPKTHKKTVSSEAVAVVDHAAKLSLDAIDNETLAVQSGESPLSRGVDFDVFYDDNHFVIELLPNGEHYSDKSLTVTYDKADLTKISESIASGIEMIEGCKASLGVVPDLICCPGYSKDAAVAAVMAAKAGSINGLYRGKAVVDIDTSKAKKYTDVMTYKNENGYTDENMIVCWPLVKVGDDIYDYSVIACAAIANCDADNGGVPYESPSNKTIPITGCINADGEEISLSVTQADILSYSAGVVTALNFDGWKLWGNYTGCYPSSTDVAKIFICTSRMMDFICNTFVNSFWGYIDRPLTRVMIDAIVNSFNSYLAGLTRDGALYGGEIQYVADNNPVSSLLDGKFRLDTSMASPVPAQQINMYCEYDVSLLTASLNV